MVEHVYEGCPLCGGDVKGDVDFKFFCKGCNIVFTKKELIASRKQLEKHVKKTIVRKFDRKVLKKVHEG